MKTADVKNYYDNFLNHLKYDHERENPRHAKIKQDLSKVVKQGMTVLDIGCGTGITTKYIAELGATVKGVDISEKLIEYAKANSAHPNATYAVKDMTVLDNDKKTYDVISLVDVAEHIPRDKILYFIQNINWRSHENTVIYLNIPDARLQTFLKQHYPNKLQIVDEAYYIREITGWFSHFGFEAISIDNYGVDFPLQYISFIFVKAGILNRSYGKYYGRG
jgi:cyclopropane fatty-acyl-phospholipid synthase-like methyltransferase